MQIKWIKICVDIFDDEKILLIESLPEADSIIVIWFKLLTLAGKQNAGGVFLLNDRIAFTDEMLATIFRRPINTVRLALKTFENFGMISIVDGAITIPNWEKHQSLEANSDRREYMKNYMKKRREQEKLLTVKKSEENNLFLENDSEKSNENNDVDNVNINSKLTLERKNKNKKESKNKKENIITTPEGVSEQVFKDFLAQRKAMKAPLTQTALTRIKNEAEKAGMTLEEALAMCCERGWRGFQADWVRKQQNKPTTGNNFENSYYGELGSF